MLLGRDQEVTPCHQTQWWPPYRLGHLANNAARLKGMRAALLQPREGTNKIPVAISMQVTCQGLNDARRE